MQDAGFDPARASHELWAFLNLNLQGIARTKSDSAAELIGLAVGTGL